MNVPESNTDFHKADIGAYERRIPVLIPGYTHIHRIAAAALGARLAPKSRVLVSGAGTGMELSQLARIDPSLRVTAVEPSCVMLAGAFARCHDLAFEAAVTFTNCTQRDFQTDDVFDGAMSVLVSHFMPDDGSRFQYYVDLRRALAPRGALVLGEILHWPDSTHIAQTWRFLAQQAGWSEREIETAEQRMTLQSFTRLTEPRLLQLLSAANFGRIQRLSQVLDVGLYLVEC